MYDKVLDTLRNHNYSLFMAFTLAGSNTVDGSWGHIVDVDSNATISYSPKYMALIDNLPSNVIGCGSLGINEIENTDKYLKIFPNPANTLINANCKDGFQIFNLSGQLIKESKLTTSTILIEDLQQGLYIIKTMNKVGKFFKQ